jgi:hypothetical protein
MNATPGEGSPAVADALCISQAELRAAITSTPSTGQAVIGFSPAQDQYPRTCGQP